MAYYKMNRRLKAKWVKALRSGKYPQGEGVLRSYAGAYCCLGVLCEAFGASAEKIVARNFPWNAGYNELIPSEIAHELADMNDDGVPFEMIAGFIQETL